MQEKMFLKLTGLQGESKSPRHFGEIELAGFSWGSKQPPSSFGGYGRFSISDLTISKHPDKTSPDLWSASTTGRIYAEGVLTTETTSLSGSLIRSISFRMESIVIASVNFDGSSEAVTLNFNNCRMVTP